MSDLHQHVKLLILIHSLSSGGAERVTVNLANYWVKRAWPVTIVTMAGQESDFYELDPSVNRIALRCDNPSAGILSAVKNNLQRVIALRGVLKHQRPDVALGMMSTSNILLSLASRGTGIPAIGSERIHPPKLPIGRVWSWLRGKAYPNLAAVVAQTEESAIWLRAKTGVRSAPVIPNPVIYPLTNRDPCLSPEALMGSADKDRTLLAVGRLAPQKGFDRLLVAFSQLASDFSEWRLVILGEGGSREALERQIVDLGLQRRVFLPGAVGNVRTWYESADLYVMTSRYEGFPNTLAEALAHGLPAISVDCETGPRDILRSGVDGLLVSQDDMGALVDALASLMGDSALRQQYAGNAVEAQARFSIKKVARMWEAIFDEVRR